jgi:hypothetical protein
MHGLVVLNKHLNRMVKTTKTHIEALGETGAGITSADQIDRTQDNAFITKWGMLLAALSMLSKCRESL